MIWSDEQVERLKTLWSQGLSTAEIGRVLGTSKNAVVGKSHRLGLEPRPSPIAGRATGGQRGKASAPKAQRIGDPVDLTPEMCRWPFGDPGDADFHFCGKAAADGKPYCQPHCELAYVTKSR